MKEQTFTGTIPLKYIWQKAKSQSRHLIVIFSGFDQVGSPPKYNYINTLKDFDCHKLFILDDYGPRGCYYLGKYNDFAVEKSVYKLIEFYRAQFEISSSNIITAGSSKGGSAALYFATKYNYGHSICGAPQSKIATYIKRNAPDTFEYIFGDHYSKDSGDKLDQVIFNNFSLLTKTEVRVLTSKFDIQYKTHIIPLKDKMEQFQLKYKIEVDDRIKNHGEIVKSFPQFLIKELAYIIFRISLDKTLIESIDAMQLMAFCDYESKNENNLQCKLMLKTNEQIIYNHVVKDQEIIDLNELTPIVAPGICYASFDFYQEEKLIFKLIVKKFLISPNGIVGDYSLTIDGSKLEFEIVNCHGLDMEFAFYIYCNGKLFDKIMYQANPTLLYTLQKDGNYDIVYFIKTKANEKISNRTKVIEFLK